MYLTVLNILYMQAFKGIIRAAIYTMMVNIIIIKKRMVD